MDDFSKLALPFVNGRPDWQAHGACHGCDPDLFFPEKNAPGTAVADAKAVCAGCLVRPECLAYAVDTYQHHGIWGGATESERRSIRRRRAVGRPRKDSAA